MYAHVWAYVLLHFAEILYMEHQSLDCTWEIKEILILRFIFFWTSFGGNWASSNAGTKESGAQTTTKKLIHWEEVLGQLLFRNRHVSKSKGPQAPPLPGPLKCDVIMIILTHTSAGTGLCYFRVYLKRIYCSKTCFKLLIVTTPTLIEIESCSWSEKIRLSLGFPGSGRTAN